MFSFFFLHVSSSADRRWVKCCKWSLMLFSKRVWGEINQQNCSLLVSSHVFSVGTVQFTCFYSRMHQFHARETRNITPLAVLWLESSVFLWFYTAGWYKYITYQWFRQLHIALGSTSIAFIASSEMVLAETRIDSIAIGLEWVQGSLL